MNPQDRADTARQSLKAIVSYAIFRLESALTIALTILLVFFLPNPLSWWHWWYWLVLGLVFELLIIYTTMTDERTGQKVVAAILREQYAPRDIKTPRYREKVEQALAYREQIEKVVTDTPMGLLRTHLYASTASIANWIGYIFAIAQRLDAYERDELVHEDMKKAPGNIRRLRRRLADEDDPMVREQTKVTLAAQEAQLDNLRALENKMEEAELRLEETIASLGTVYSQFQLVRTRKMSSTRTKHLSASIRDQEQRLQDILDSMDKVYGKK